MVGNGSEQNALERGFELARSGEYPTVEPIRRKIGGDTGEQLQGASLHTQLWNLIRATRPR